MEGHPVRFTGQDVERGTFSHRHAVVKVEDSEEEFIHLKHIQQGQALLQIYNSLLSEYAVLGFEYGYALANAGCAHHLGGAVRRFRQRRPDRPGPIPVLRRGEMGHAEWCGLVASARLRRPRCAEHSSARMERFLQSCADLNMVVVNCTTPANFFHVLRRQLTWDFRKPLVVFTPKSLLRHPRCVSALDEFTTGGFQEIIDDASVDAKAGAHRDLHTGQGPL
jgi:2-oxoglutarate dehydrogenase E1 component